LTAEERATLRGLARRAQRTPHRLDVAGEAPLLATDH
jgi:hypothetical protein